MRKSVYVLLAISAILMMSSCGKKGELEPPEGYDKADAVEELRNLA